MMGTWGVIILSSVLQNIFEISLLKGRETKQNVKKCSEILRPYTTKY